MLNIFLLNKEYNRLWKLFEKDGFLTKKQFKEAIRLAEKEKRYLTEMILEDDSLPEDKSLEVLSEFFNLPVVYLRNKVISPQVINLLPKEISEEHRVIVFKKVKDEIFVATTAPENKQIIKFIGKKTELTPKVFITTPKDIKLALNKYNNTVFSDGISHIVDLNNGDDMESQEVPAEKMAGLVPVIKMVNNAIETGISNGASDIHIEPGYDKLKIRMRVDGILHKIVELPRAMLPAVITRVKILANLKIDEHMAPQDGRFQYKFNDKEVALRVSVMPTLYGPKAVLRLLEMKEKMLTLQKLGLNKIHLRILKKEIYTSHGMILVTGPTGSGKTTTLYTLLRMLNSEKVNICTIEDPIEYGIEDINQVQVRPKHGLTFASGLRALLRQDPDVLMVGEIRDIETANIAINSAMTGHLVLSTLHTNNAFLTPQRLMEMDAQPYLVTSVLNVIIGQRLVRKLCPHCKIKSRAPEKLLENFTAFIPVKETYRKLQNIGLIPKDQKFSEVSFYRSRGCRKCGETGYKGRVGIYEIIYLDDDLRKFILNDPNETNLREHLLKRKVMTMIEDGLLKVFNSQTTIDEILRVTKE